MSTTESLPLPLFTVYDGWDGYRRSLVAAIAPRTPEELAFRLAPGLNSVGEIARHIAAGRVFWFQFMDAPTCAELASRMPDEAAIPADNAATLVYWLEESGRMIDATLTAWTVADLQTTYPHTYRGQTYAVSRQWTIWRILSHDMHHGGQLSMLLYQQSIDIPELGDLGGHLTEPPLAPSTK